MSKKLNKTSKDVVVDEIPVISYFFDKILKKKEGVLVDVGAHVGFFSDPFLKKGWEAYCFEPEDKNHSELRQNLEKYSKVHFIKKAASNENLDRVPFYVSDEHWGIHTLRPFHETHKLKMEITTVRLDDFLKLEKVKGVDFLKVDAEGADYLVLQGMDWKNFHPSIVMTEFMDSRTVPNFNYSYHDVVKYMKNLGYSCFVFAYTPVQEYARKGIAGVSRGVIGIFPYKTKDNYLDGNLVFCKKNQISAFKRAVHGAIKEASPPNHRIQKMLPLKFFRTLLPEPIKKRIRPIRKRIFPD